jgi:hypothetical protein
MVKALKKLGLEGTLLNIMKFVYYKPIASILLKGEILKSFPLKSGNETSMSPLSTLIQHSAGMPRHSNKRKK